MGWQPSAFTKEGQMARAVMIGGKPFECVKLSEADFADNSAIYVVLCYQRNRSWTILDVGRVGPVGTRIDDYEKYASWVSSCTKDNLWVCIYRMPSPQYTREDREQFEAQLRKEYEPLCDNC